MSPQRTLWFRDLHDSHMSGDSAQGGEGPSQILTIVLMIGVRICVTLALRYFRQRGAGAAEGAVWRPQHPRTQDVSGAAVHEVAHPVQVCVTIF